MRIKVRVGYDEEGRFATFEGNEDDVAEVLTWLLCDLGGARFGGDCGGVERRISM